VSGILEGYPAWNRPDIYPFLAEEAPEAAPSILNAERLGIDLYE
jgi:hydroxypyruvate reductase 1